MRPNGNICLGCLLAKCAHVEKAKVECFISFSFLVYHFVLLAVLAQLLTHLLGGRLNLLTFPYRIAFLYFPVQCWFKMIVTMWKKMVQFLFMLSSYIPSILSSLRLLSFLWKCVISSKQIFKFCWHSTWMLVAINEQFFSKIFFSSLSNLFRITSKQYHIQMKICGSNCCNSFIAAMR